MDEGQKDRHPSRPEFFGLPIVGVDLGEKLGSLDARMIQTSLDVAEIKRSLKTGEARIEAAEVRLTDRLEAVETKLTARIEAVETKLTDRIEAVEIKLEAVETKLTAKIEEVDSRVDKCLVAIARLDERTAHLEARLDEKMTNLENRLDEKMANLEARLDEKTAHLINLINANARSTWIIGASLLVAIIATKFI